MSVKNPVIRKVRRRYRVYPEKLISGSLFPIKRILGGLVLAFFLLPLSGSVFWNLTQGPGPSPTLLEKIRRYLEPWELTSEGLVARVPNRVSRSRFRKPARVDALHGVTSGFVLTVEEHGAKRAPTLSSSSSRAQDRSGPNDYLALLHLDQPLLSQSTARLGNLGALGVGLPGTRLDFAGSEMIPSGLGGYFSAQDGGSFGDFPIGTWPMSGGVGGGGTGGRGGSGGGGPGGGGGESGGGDNGRDGGGADIPDLAVSDPLTIGPTEIADEVVEDVSEPGTLILLGLGLVAVMPVWRRFEERRDSS